jgi:hypothetical protein
VVELTRADGAVKRPLGEGDPERLLSHAMQQTRLRIRTHSAGDTPCGGGQGAGAEECST